MSLELALAALRQANRIDGTRASYRKDNPAEYVKVMAYLDGAARPAGADAFSFMGQGLVWVEDHRRAEVLPPPPPPPPPPSGTRMWADTSPINQLVPTNVQVLTDYGQGSLSGLPGINFNGGGWGVAVFRDTSGSRRTVTIADGWKLDNVPAPAQFDDYVNAMLSLGDSEHHSVIFDGDRAHNIYSANPGLTTAGAMAELRKDGSGFWNNNLGPWAGRASGFCSATGAVLKSELDAGLVDHALALGWPKDRIGSAHVDPASTSDGSAGGGGFPMGSRLQLDPTLTDAQIMAFGISSYFLPVAKALQRYGGFICDSTSLMVIYAESWNDNGRVSWPSGWSGSNLIPHLRRVASPAAPVYDDRTVFGQPHKP